MSQPSQELRIAFVNCYEVLMLIHYLQHVVVVLTIALVDGFKGDRGYTQQVRKVIFVLLPKLRVNVLLYCLLLTSIVFLFAACFNAFFGRLLINGRFLLFLRSCFLGQFCLLDRS